MTLVPRPSIKEALWPLIPGTEHNALIMFFSLLKSVDEKALIGPLTAAEHIKLLKKAKAASPELDYKVLVSCGGGAGGADLGGAEGADVAAHVVCILRPDNVALLSKLLRTLPPALSLPTSLNAILARWLTRHFFSVPSNAASKKWMQQYRQCASYFNKLTKHELLQFVEDTCFSDEAIQRVPAGTRNLMIMQAVDYCQQEQENDFKFNKNEQSWAAAGQELSRWARFLDNLHSDTVQHLLHSAALPALDIWPEVEKSHGDPERLIDCLARGMLQAEIRPGALTRLLQCLHVPVQPDQLLQHVAQHCHSASDVETLVSRMTAYSKEGVKLPEELLETVMQKASEFAVPPHKQIGLLSLSQKTRVHDSDDMLKISQFSVELFRTEWPDSDHAGKLTDEMLLSEEGRRDAFSKFLSLADSWQRKKALVDVLQCWPPTRNSDSRSLHCEYLHHLLADKSNQTENLMLIKLLLQRPVLTAEEVKWLADNVGPESVINAIWVLLLSKTEHFKDNILNLALQHKTFLQNHEIDEDLIKELLDNGMFIKLVPCPLYASLINYIIGRQAAGDEAGAYSVAWAAAELGGARLAAEAGQLRLAAAGLPASLRGFSQAVVAGLAESARAFAYFKDVLDE